MITVGAVRLIGHQAAALAGSACCDQQ